MFAYFDVQHIYYIPQYLPVIKKLTGKGHQCVLVFYKSQDAALITICNQFIEDNQVTAVWLTNTNEAFNFYQNCNADWIIFGNAFAQSEALNKKTAMMQHGIGPKQCYYDVSNAGMTVRFVEGEHRKNRLEALYPNGNFVDSGYAKLDPLFNQSVERIQLTSLGLDPQKPTLLYAPTFYPSSIECMSDGFADDFSAYNIIIKPHFFSLTKPRYKKQRVKLARWKQSKNVFIADTNQFDLTPFLAVSDIMLSDASSAIFEFAALDKPVIWCDFYKLRWSYRGVFSFRLKERLDDDIHYFNEICHPARDYNQIAEKIEQAAKESEAFKENRAALIKQLAGRTDGLSTNRIVDYLEEHI
ncbi:CDP-glycerol glycerophosphotransferase family protein [Pseudoalteromonas sp. H105]|uniref:CDP-glycerol glycerophosphotransferase family protein n=1 Tax=Pseudoalteromonas sp. H105 TaxID=1348393 RepID=UPI000731FF35|nr:CDP-glycerol glycerophosphotransferase family protein [Pseudoalteromonas sp. H105]KTF12187.1 CDP-glycerol glycerophosphotransferase [Pseudoalteromonas sp. H105]